MRKRPPVPVGKQRKKMAEIDRFLTNVRTAAIAGHVNPDGDCIGSCMAMFLYLRDNYPEIRTSV